MKPGTFPPLVEAILILDQPRQRLGHWSHLLAPIDDGRAPRFATITASFDPATDQALVGLRYDERVLGHDRLAFIIEIAQLAEIGVILPNELDDAERRQFIDRRISRCSIHVAEQRTVIGALTELVRRSRDRRLVPGSVAARGSIHPMGTAQDPVLLVHPKSTRDDMQTLRRTASPNVIARPSRVHRAPTVEMAAADLQRLANDPGPPHDPSPNTIYARYLRSGRWVPVRVAALSLKGATVMSGALPKLRDHVDIALSYGDHHALVHGSVDKLSSIPRGALAPALPAEPVGFAPVSSLRSSNELAASPGATMFSVGFELDITARSQLMNLLIVARAGRVTIKPPPPRGTRRFPVDWPICVGTANGAVRADALDVSREGMFVRTAHALAVDAVLGFSVVLDDGDPPISGRATVVRRVRDAEARSCGITPGFGFHITAMSGADLARWVAFLDRIEKRADKRVVVGAPASRLPHLQAALAAVGYAVTGVTDPDTLVVLGSSERPIDAVLIDAGWLAPGATLTRIEAGFSARNVPCVTVHGEARRGPLVIDRLFTVAT